jgi:hypothetical protein
MIQLLEPSAGTFREVVIEEDVRVQQAAPDGAIAWEINGQRLQITPQGDQRFRLAVSGSPQSPTRVQAQQMLLTGQIVQLDQTANRLWIDGSGHLRAEQIIPREKKAAPDAALAVDIANGEARTDDRRCAMVRWLALTDNKSISNRTSSQLAIRPPKPHQPNRLAARRST